MSTTIDSGGYPALGTRGERQTKEWPVSDVMLGAPVHVRRTAPGRARHSSTNLRVVRDVEPEGAAPIVTRGAMALFQAALALACVAAVYIV